jgi:hypothetical protein
MFDEYHIPHHGIVTVLTQDEIVKFVQLTINGVVMERLRVMSSVMTGIIIIMMDVQILV